MYINLSINIERTQILMKKILQYISQYISKYRNISKYPALVIRLTTNQSWYKKMYVTYKRVPIFFYVIQDFCLNINLLYTFRHDVNYSTRILGSRSVEFFPSKLQSGKIGPILTTFFVLTKDAISGYLTTTLYMMNSSYILRYVVN